MDYRQYLHPKTPQDILQHMDAWGGFPGSLVLSFYKYPLPDYLRYVSGDLDLRGYEYPLPARFWGVGGRLDVDPFERGPGRVIPAYDHPLPDGFNSVGDTLVLHGYNHPLPDSLFRIGRLITSDYPYPLPQKLASVDDLYLDNYEHALPKRLTGVGGTLNLVGYKRRLPRSFQTVDGSLVLSEVGGYDVYDFPLPGSLMVRGKIFAQNYLHPLPQKLITGTGTLEGFYDQFQPRATYEPRATHETSGAAAIKKNRRKPPQDLSSQDLSASAAHQQEAIMPHSRLHPNSPHARMTYVLKSLGDKVARDTFNVVGDRYATNRDPRAYVLNKLKGDFEWTDLTAENLQNEIDKSFPDGPPRSGEALIPWVGQRLAAQQKEVRKGRLGTREYDELVDSLKRMLPQIQTWAEHTQPDLTKLSIADAISQAAAFEDPGASVWVSQGEVIYRFADGWTIQNLTEPKQIFHEGISVQNCLKEGEQGAIYLDAVMSGKKRIFSLRKPSGLPVVSISYIPSEQRFDEILAKHNTPLGISLDSMLGERKWKQRPEQARALWSKIQEYKPRIAEFLAAFGADAFAFVMADAPLPAELTTLGYDQPVPTALNSAGGSIGLSGYSHPLPARLVSVGRGLDLIGYKHPLPAGLTSVGGYLGLFGYKHPLPAGLASVGTLSLAGYKHPLPAGLVVGGSIFGADDYPFPLPGAGKDFPGRDDVKQTSKITPNRKRSSSSPVRKTSRKPPRKTSKRAQRKTSRS